VLPVILRKRRFLTGEVWSSSILALLAPLLGAVSTTAKSLDDQTFVCEKPRFRGNDEQKQQSKQQQKKAVFA
jgi:hypothetical protein